MIEKYWGEMPMPRARRYVTISKRAKKTTVGPFRLIILVGLVVLGVGCDQGSRQRPPQEEARPSGQESAHVAKVKVTRAGTIYLDGKTVSLAELKQEFVRLKRVQGVVWYYRENPQGEPPPQAMAVIEAIVETKLPVKLVERDFE
jgi:hypothetical protein